MNSKNPKTCFLISDQEKKQIRKLYKKLCRLIKAQENTKQGDLKAAFQMSYEQHQYTRRKSGDPYIVHPLNVALILVEEMGITEVETIICALLHDVVEDTPMTLEEIEERFGEQVAFILNALTKVNESLYENKDNVPIQAINFQKLFSHFAQDMRICAIKIADRLDNMRSLEFLSKNKQLKIAHETKKFYAPLAHRLGLGSVKSCLEDLYLKHVEPDSYKSVAKNVQLHKINKSKIIKEFAAPIIQALNEQKIKYRVETRLKSIYSIYSKMLKKQISFDSINDICGLRIILDCEKENEIKKCWEVYSIITGLYHINPARTRDWLSTPRLNGYESLHITAMSKKGEWVEVQIRSERMHKIATHGIAAHWKYKQANGSGIGDIANYQELMKQMGELAKQDIDISQAVRDAHLALYEKDICIFTDGGNRIFLPRGSTVFDFAIETMLEKGAYCSYAIVDGEKHSKDYVLSNGQQVNSISINLSQKLEPEWTDLTNTPKARKIWKQVLSEFGKKKKNSTKLKIKKLLRQYDIELSPDVEKELKFYFKQNVIDDVYYKVSSGSIPFPLVEGFVKQKVKSMKIHDGSEDEKPPQHLFLRGDKSDVYELAHCCGPVLGDDLLAAAIPERSIIEVHCTDCPEAANISSQNADSIVSASWYRTDYTFKRNIVFKARLSKETKRNIIHAIHKFDIVSFNFDPDSDSVYTKVSIVLNVQNVHELDSLLGAIRKIGDVVEIKRKNYV